MKPLLLILLLLLSSCSNFQFVGSHQSTRWDVEINNVHSSNVTLYLTDLEVRLQSADHETQFYWNDIQTFKATRLPSPTP